MNYENWEKRWKTTLEAVSDLGGKVADLEVQGKADAEEVAAVESKLGFRLPGSLRDVFSEFSKAVNFSWELPESFERPEELREIWMGECRWDLEDIVGLDEVRERWVEKCFPDVNDSYDKVWHEKLALFHVANGDMIALDLSASGNNPVVYLSHDGAAEHGYILGDSFEDFMERWTKLGCVGTECWQLAPFLDSPTGCLNPAGENAKLFSNVLGLT